MQSISAPGESVELRTNNSAVRQDQAIADVENQVGEY